MIRMGARQILGVAIIGWFSVLCLEGCKLLKKGGAEEDAAVATPEAVADAGAAATPAVDGAAPTAAAGADAGIKLAEPANAADVARFPGETKIADEAAKLLANTTLVHKAPPSTGLVATLNKGADVVKLASFGDDFVVQFANPKNASEQLVGWVNKAAFAATPVTKKTCAKPQELFADGLCHQPCTKPEQCPKGNLCNGVEMRASLDGGASLPINFCQAAPPPAAVDAGAPKPLVCASPKVAAVFPNEKVATCRKPCKNDADCKGQAKACASAKGADGKAVTACINE
jgi:hypothetical protein